jgi:hypothetical protein
VIPDWLPDHQIDLTTRKKVAFAHGLGSATGATTFETIRQELAGLGFGPGDFLEITPRVVAGVPMPYVPDDLRRPLADSIAGTGACLAWYLQRLPADQEIHLIGYSLGGLLLIRALATLLALHADIVAGRVGSVISLNAPLAGLPPDAPGLVGALIGVGRHIPEAEQILDPILRDLIREGRDPAAEARRDEEFRRILAAGISVAVIGSLDDQIVAPIRVAPDLPGLDRVEIVNETTIRPTLQVDRLLGRLFRAGQEHGLPLPGLDRPGATGFWLGHNHILSDPAALLAVWEHVGRQEPAPGR